MERLTVLYDAECGFCTKCRWWLAMQPQIVALEFLAAGSPEAARRFPGLDAGELAAVAEDGAVYRGPAAFIMCLWALEEYRELAHDLSSPLLLPFARKAFEVLSASRRGISALFGLKGEAREAVERAAGEQEGAPR